MGSTEARLECVEKLGPLCRICFTDAKIGNRDICSCYISYLACAPRQSVMLGIASGVGGTEESPPLSPLQKADKAYGRQGDFLLVL